MNKLLTMNPDTPGHRITRTMRLQGIVHAACIKGMGEPPTRALRDEVGSDAISAVLMQGATMLSAFYDAETGKDTDGIELGNRLIEVANQWIDEQTASN